MLICHPPKLIKSLLFNLSWPWEYWINIFKEKTKKQTDNVSQYFHWHTTTFKLRIFVVYINKHLFFIQCLSISASCCSMHLYSSTQPLSGWIHLKSLWEKIDVKSHNGFKALSRSDIWHFYSHFIGQTKSITWSLK